jgi:hypothetical protein
MPQVRRAYVHSFASYVALGNSTYAACIVLAEETAFMAGMLRLPAGTSVFLNNELEIKDYDTTGENQCSP